MNLKYGFIPGAHILVGTVEMGIQGLLPPISGKLSFLAN